MLAKHKNLIYKTIIAIVLVILSVVIYIYIPPLYGIFLQFNFNTYNVYQIEKEEYYNKNTIVLLY